MYDTEASKLGPWAKPWHAVAQSLTEYFFCVRVRQVSCCYSDAELSSWKKPLFSRLAVTKRIDFVFVWALLSWPGSSVELVCLDGSRPRRKMMERKKLLRRILHVQMLLELGALWSMTDWTGGMQKWVCLALTKKLVLCSHAHFMGAAIDKTGNGFG